MIRATTFSTAKRTRSTTTMRIATANSNMAISISFFGAGEDRRAAVRSITRQ